MFRRDQSMFNYRGVLRIVAFLVEFFPLCGEKPVIHLEFEIIPN